MSDEIPQDIARRAVEACKEFVRKVEAGQASSKRSYAEMKSVLDDLDALSTPPDPAEVAAREIDECVKVDCGGKLISYPSDAHRENVIRAAYADHFKQDAERDKAVRALSDWLLGAYPPEYGHKQTVRLNTDVRRLHPEWDREGR